MEGAHEGRRWTWELKSVNGRGLEMRLRLPPGYDALEPELKKAAAAVFSRGSLIATLTLDKTAGGAGLKINRAALGDALRMIEEIGQRLDCAKPRAEGILNIRGVAEYDEGEGDEESRAAFFTALTASFGEAARALKASRDKEGERLSETVASEIDDIERLAGSARAHAAAAPEAIRARIAAQLSELLAGAALPEERIAQEAALLAIKADVREELDRLDAHVGAARSLLAETGPTGRRLDFLTQEFNREANTLCSKAQDMGLKRLGLDLKTVIDQMREQVQNIE